MRSAGSPVITREHAESWRTNNPTPDNMKYFKFWTKTQRTIDVDGTAQKIQIITGSNISKADACRQAVENAKAIEQRILSRACREEYQVPIKEHVAEEFDRNNIVTVCRYGAKILNTTDYTILDLDTYAFDFWDLFKAIRKLPKKERIVAKFLQRRKKYPEIGNDFRIYETAKGIRIIGKKYIAPDTRNYQTLMRKFAVDDIYVLMSKRQDCYRARLTPKPYRMKINTIKIRTPLDCETQDYRNWSEQYENASQNYCVVKHITSIGKDFSSDPIIAFHDTICGAHRERKLA